MSCPEKVGNKWVALFLRADVPNSNNRLYPRFVLEKNVNNLKSVISSRALIGQLGMPNDSIIHFKNASHLITDIRFKKDDLECEVELLDTLNGLTLKELLEKTPEAVRFRPQGIGNGKVNENGILILNDSYKLITINALSTSEASYYEG